MGCAASCACKTIKDGDVYAVSGRSGRVRVVEGPARKWRCGNFFKKLELVVAGEDEYLTIMHRDGSTELRQGPAAVVQHPVDHVSAERRSSLRIDEQELIVVYRKSDDGSVKRELVHGPGIYMPQSVSEWLHEFSWTGASERDGLTSEKATKRVNGLKFTKLRTCPGKTYYDVESVRTKDNALITVKLMIFYKYTNVETMLDNSNDPFGDFINAASADIIEWCSTKKFDDFLAATDVLNTLEPYAQLRVSASKIGMAIEKVVFRGYAAPDALQRMHNNAIEKRTALALENESEEEEQKLADYKLDKESERATRKAQLDMERLNHELAIKQKSAEQTWAQEKEAHAIELARLKEIKALDKNFDIGKYLIAKDCTHPPVYQCGSMMTATATQS